MRWLPAFGRVMRAPSPGDLHDLLLDAQQPRFEIDVTTSKAEHLPQAGVRPERQGHQRPQLGGHGGGQGLHIRQVEQRTFGGGRLPGALDAARVALQHVVGDRCDSCRARWRYSERMTVHSTFEQ